jgi:hypothetical protein
VVLRPDQQSLWSSILNLMNRLARVVIAISVLLAAANVWSQEKQDYWGRYEPRTLQSIIDTNQEFAKKLNSDKKAMLLTGDNFPSKVRLTYMVDSRPLPAEQKVLMDSYRKAMKDNAPAEDVFTTQIRFEEDSCEYWILVQKPLLDALPKELSKGQALDAYVMWIGAIKVGKRWEWLFAMNEFEAFQKPAAAPER